MFYIEIFDRETGRSCDLFLEVVHGEAVVCMDSCMPDRYRWMTKEEAEFWVSWFAGDDRARNAFLVVRGSA